MMVGRHKRWMGALVAVACTLALGITLAVRSPERTTLVATAEELRHTIITPHLEQAITGDANVLWCSTFQLAWNELCELAGGDVHMERESPMMGLLNRRAATKRDLDEESYVAAAGIIGDGVVSRIEDAFALNFPNQPYPELCQLARGFPPNMLLAYAYLFKDLPFRCPFDRSPHPLYFGTAKVAAFGIDDHYGQDQRKTAMASQVIVLEHTARQGPFGPEGAEPEFIVELRTRSELDRLILAKVAPAETLGETVAHVRSRVQAASPTRFRKHETLMVPVLDFDVTRSYAELCFRAIAANNKRVNGRVLDIAVQAIRFRLNEKGAALESEALLAERAKPIGFIFSGPSLIMLERKGAENPYFALWVANAELLTPYER